MSEENTDQTPVPETGDDDDEEEEDQEDDE